MTSCGKGEKVKKVKICKSKTCHKMTSCDAINYRKLKAVVKNEALGATEKSKRLAPIVRSFRNDHKI